MDELEALEESLSAPSDAARSALASLDGDIAVLGAGGKMGPTLCRLLKRAVPGRRVFGVSRFSDPAVKARLAAAGVETIEADLLDRAAFRLVPPAPNVYYLVGMKFGASADLPLTWAMNAYVPALACEHFPRSRIVALSSGNVYPFVSVTSGGAAETTEPGPVGEYAQSCLARERIFEYFSRVCGTPVCLVRLNYANEPRYGVIVDLARQILAGQPVDLSTGFVNVIWQGDANDYIARAVTLARSPAAVLNVAGTETVSVRWLAVRIAGVLGRDVVFSGAEAPTALLSNAARCAQRFGPPRVGLEEMVARIGRWLAKGGATLGKPTKFQIRDGRF